MPHSPIKPCVAPKNTHPMPNTEAGRKVSTAQTPSRDSQEERHCENARQARSGRPRWKAEEPSPATASAIAAANATKANQLLSGSKPSGAPIPSSSSSPKPAPDAVVNKTIESAGCIARGSRGLGSSERQQPVDPAQQLVGRRSGDGGILDACRCWISSHSPRTRRQVLV